MVELTDQALKSSFRCTLLMWVRRIMDRMPMSMVDFVD